MRSYLILSSLAVLSLAQSVPPLCNKCNCENQDNKFRLTCRNDVTGFIFNSSYWLESSNKTYPYHSLDIQNTPVLTLKDKFPPSNITYLRLENTSLVNISDSVFSNLQDMVTLSLSYNYIEIIHPNAFDGKYLDNEFRPLKSLISLLMDHNKIHSLDADLFEHTPNLEYLSISHNPFKVLDHNTEIAITSLVFLKKLDLSYCGLTTLPDNFLHTPKFLYSLDLSGNGFTTIPETLGDSHNLTILYLNSHSIVNLTSETGFPNISTLRTLYFSESQTLINITKGAFSNLENLEELYLSKNPELTNIDSLALGTRRNGAEYTTWPPLKKLYLQENKLSYIDMQLVLQWKDLTELDLTHNPWTCECENQWIVDELMPIYLKLDEERAKAMKCAAPIEMVSFTFYDIYKQEKTMRCLDLYGHRPERDGTLLVGLLAGILITIPLVLFIIYAYQRHWFGLFDSSPAAYNRQFYKRGASSDDGQF